MRLLVTRPEPEATRMKTLLEARGHQVVLEPLMRAVFRPEAIPSLKGVGALIAPSRNAIRALRQSHELAFARSLPLFAVGAGTAEEALAAGFERIVQGPGTAMGLSACVASTIDPFDGIIVHLAGDELAADLAGALEPHGFRVIAPVVYEMQPAQALSEATREALIDRTIDAVLLMSGRTAKIYAQLVTKHRLIAALADIPHLCLSHAVTRGLAPLGLKHTRVAEEPTLKALVALIEVRERRLDY